MAERSGNGVLAQVLRGYAAVLRSAAFAVAVVLTSGLLGAAIAAPLWLFATRATGLYNLVVIAALLVAVLAGLLAPLLRGLRAAPDQGRYLRRLTARAANALLRSLIVVAMLYLLLLVFTRIGVGVGLAALAPCLAVIGLALFVRRRGQTA